MKAWLFDLDGTLLDTAPDLHRALSTLLAEEDREAIPLELMRRYVSRGARGLVRLAFGEVADDTALTTRLVEHYARDIASATRLFDGLEPLPEALKARGLTWGIVTNKPIGLARPLIAALGLNPGTLLGGDSTARAKPDPGSLWLASAHLALPAAQCWYLGDAPRDIEAGRAAGMRRKPGSHATGSASSVLRIASVSLASFTRA